MTHIEKVHETEIDGEDAKGHPVKRKVTLATIRIDHQNSIVAEVTDELRARYPEFFRAAEAATVEKPKSKPKANKGKKKK